jgi:hypothetical protein
MPLLNIEKISSKIAARAAFASDDTPANVA